MYILLNLVLKHSDGFEEGRGREDEPFWTIGWIRAVPPDSLRSVEDGLVNFESAVEMLVRSSLVVEESVASVRVVELLVDRLGTCVRGAVARISVVSDGIDECEMKSTVQGGRDGGPLPGGAGGGGPGNGKFGRAGGGGGPPNKLGGGR